MQVIALFSVDYFIMSRHYDVAEENRMTDVTIRIFGAIATTNGEGWESDDRDARGYLNLVSDLKHQSNYFPYPALELLRQVQEAGVKIEVISIENVDENDGDPETIY